jgi:serine/threonine protein kinase
VKGTLGYLAPEYAMLGKASESCDVFSFGILLLELASGKKPIEKLNPTTKLTITEWALPLACDKKFKEIADSKLKDSFVEDELKRMVLVGLLCSQNNKEQRPIMSEVVDLLKGESAEKLSNLENDELFKSERASSCQGSSRPDSSDCITEEKSSKADVVDDTVDSNETVPSAG